MKALLFLLLVIPEISIFALFDPSDMATYTTSRYGPPPAIATATRRPINYSYYNPFVKYRPIEWLGDTGKEDPKCMTGYCVPKSRCKWDFWRALPDGYLYSDFERAGLEGPNDGVPRPEEESENKIEEKGEKKIKKIKKKIETKIEEKVEEMIGGKIEEKDKAKKAADENNISEKINEKETDQGENS
ncbi:unnamed protein product [Clonostachys rhizophaga]|uniref:Secreted protein n=1 Tax=Clonostachys rhizophaga TaxID=160324 RepID=A0A9N9V2H0_9HYPO|nr:unnamed protein product [Clonostachys rhizophaga]